MQCSVTVCVRKKKDSSMWFKIIINEFVFRDTTEYIYCLSRTNILCTEAQKVFIYKGEAPWGFEGVRAKPPPQNFSNLGAQKYHFMCFPHDIFRNTKKNSIVSSLFYISSVIDKVCTVFTEKRVKQDKKRN